MEHGMVRIFRFAFATTAPSILLVQHGVQMSQFAIIDFGQARYNEYDEVPSQFLAVGYQVPFDDHILFGPRRRGGGEPLIDQNAGQSGS
jgi:hypothetical protein